jgi:isopropylmalate/homocitrate/citramalate synthase
MKLKDKLQIFEYLRRIGVEKLEVFLYTENDRKAARSMIERGYEKPIVTGWSRAKPSDIDQVLKMDGIGETGILMSISDSHILTKMGLKDREAAEEIYLGALDYALDHGLRTRAHLEDITRSDLHGFVYPLVSKIVERDPHCTIRLCDTVGFGVPFYDPNDSYSMPQIVSKMIDLGVKNIETHIHDDFGLAMANTLAGFWHGANWSSLTFLGIGERSGNCELEKVLVFLSQRIEGFQKYDLSSLTEFALYIEENLGIRVPPNKAVVGKNVFAHESGIHTAGIIKNPFIYEPFSPELVGGRREILIGSSSGREVVRFKVEEALFELSGRKVILEKSDRRVTAIYSLIKKLYEAEERVSCISDEEISRLVGRFWQDRSILDYEQKAWGEGLVPSGSQSNNEVEGNDQGGRIFDLRSIC